MGDFFSGLALGSVFFGVFAVVTYNWGLDSGVRSVRHEAIKQGCAERVMVDSLNGTTEFRWRAAPNAGKGE